MVRAGLWFPLEDNWLCLHTVLVLEELRRKGGISDREFEAGQKGDLVNVEQLQVTSGAMYLG